jgi:pimeloyl-ACP methyl ester carboxylesterase
MFFAAVLFAILTAAPELPPAPAPAHANPNLAVRYHRGTFSDGATYLIEVPNHWNKTLVLYSHGYVSPGGGNPAYAVGDSATGYYLLSQGYALAGSSYASAGWAVQQALPDQIEVLDTFASLVGKPRHTIAWGHSMGGLITAALVQQYPARFDAGLPMCGAVAGGVDLWNDFLDQAYAFNLLLAGGQLQIVNIADAYTNYENAETALGNAQTTAQGQARLALVAALADIPGWYQTGSPPPPPRDYTAREANQFLWLQNAEFLFEFFLRAELEGRAGGNPSWNTGVDYRLQLARSADFDEVAALYAKAGLDLGTDVRALNEGARVAPNPKAIGYLVQNIILRGPVRVPVLTLHTVGDGLVVPEGESDYQRNVGEDGDAALFRQIYVNRAGHCAFTSAETIAAFEVLETRLNSGRWPSLDPLQLNFDAEQVGSEYNSSRPAYRLYEPQPFLRTLGPGAP